MPVFGFAAKTLHPVSAPEHELVICFVKLAHDAETNENRMPCREATAGNQTNRAALRSDWGGWPKARMKARRIRSGSRKPV